MKLTIKKLILYIGLAINTTATITSAQATPINLLPVTIWPTQPINLLPDWTKLPPPISTESIGLPLEEAKTVETLGSTKQNDQQIDCIASAIHHEARGEPLKGKIAIAEVILARVKVSRFGATPCAVVAQRGQFSFVHHGIIPSVPSSNLAEMRKIAAQVINGEVHSRVRGALYFHAASIHTSWGQKVAGRIGHHIFYRQD